MAVTVAVKRSAEQEPLVELLALVAVPGAPVVARELTAAGDRPRRCADVPKIVDRYREDINTTAGA